MNIGKNIPENIKLRMKTLGLGIPRQTQCTGARNWTAFTVFYLIWISFQFHTKYHFLINILVTIFLIHYIAPHDVYAAIKTYLCNP
jgi:hypothetical protein